MWQFVARVQQQKYASLAIDIQRRFLRFRKIDVCSYRFEGHRGDAPGVVATLAMLLEDRQHIAIKARGIP